MKKKNKATTESQIRKDLRCQPGESKTECLRQHCHLEPKFIFIRILITVSVAKTAFCSVRFILSINIFGLEFLSNNHLKYVRKYSNIENDVPDWFCLSCREIKAYRGIKNSTKTSKPSEINIRSRNSSWFRKFVTSMSPKCFLRPLNSSLGQAAPKSHENKLRLQR